MSELKAMPAGSDVSALIMAMIDGKASAAEASRIQGVLARNPHLEAEAEAYRLTSHENIMPLFDGIMNQPAPGQILHSIMTTEPAAAARQAVKLRPVRGGWLLPLAGLFAGAVAAALAIVVFGGGLVPATTELASASVSEALSASSSGGERIVATKAGDIAINVVQSFRDKSGAVCREYEAQGAIGGRDYGVACRQQGGWRVVAKFTGERITGPKIQTAGNPLNDRLDGLADTLRSGDPLSKTDEQKLIDDGWKTTP